MGIRKGFEELPHTADRAFRVWAGNLEELFEEAARALYSVSACDNVSSIQSVHKLSFEAQDIESLLVKFLNELNHLLDQGFFTRIYHIKVDRCRLDAHLEGNSDARLKKEVKAITYHNLEIKKITRGFEVTLVFDV